MSQVSIHYPIIFTLIDYPDPSSIAILVNFKGCEHNCVECQNSTLQEYEKNPYMDGQTLYNILIIKTQEYDTKAVVFSGGDSLAPRNLEFTKSFLKQFGNSFDICIYTGYKIEYVKENKIIGFQFIKCGKFEKSLQQHSIKNDGYIQFASSNQELYDYNYRKLSSNGIYYFKN
jgi:organic radical activating enzyme